MKRKLRDLAELLLVVLVFAGVAAAIAESAGGAEPRVNVLEFYADWCLPCRAFSHTIKALIAEGYPITRINVDANQPAARQWRVIGLPTCIAVLDGREIARVEGQVTRDRVLALFNANSPASAPIAAPAVVRIANQLQAETNVGTGFIAGQADGRAVVFTSRHLFREGTGDVWIRLFDSRELRGIPWQLDASADLAAIVISDPGIEPMQIAEVDPAPGEHVVSYGWGGGTFAASPGQVMEYNPANPWLFASGTQRDGDSGAPLVDSRGHVVACLWARTPAGQRYGCRPGPLRRLLLALIPGCRRPMVAVPRTGQATPKPSLPIPSQTPPAVTQPEPPAASTAAPMTPAPLVPPTPPQALPATPASGASQSPAPAPPATSPSSPSSQTPPTQSSTPPSSMPAWLPTDSAGPQASGVESQPASSGSSYPWWGKWLGLAGIALWSVFPSYMAAKWIAGKLASAAIRRAATASGALGHVAGAGAGLVVDQFGKVVGQVAGSTSSAVSSSTSVEVPTVPVITAPNQIKTETLYVSVPVVDPREEAKRAAERHIAASNSQAAAFFMYRDRLAASQLPPQSV
jgi:thiol-disulfide isomerase/thioredoxin